MKLILLFWAVVLPSSALIFFDDGDQEANTESIPTGAYVNAGWQHQIVITRGTSTYLATMISPKHFIAAAHVGLGSGDDRIFVTQPDFFTGSGLKTYTVRDGSSPVRIQFSYTPPPTPEEPDPEPELRNVDLFVFEIWETFDSYAGLYAEDDEDGQEVVITGYGDARGSVVMNSMGQDRGWAPDISNRKARWGTNIVDGEAQTDDEITDQGLLLYCDFDATGAGKTPFECQGANKDSSGGWFIKDGPNWELAAINYGVDTYGASSGSTGNRWAIYDGVGLYHSSSPLPITAGSFYRRSHTYATRISEHVDAIEAVIGEAKATGLLSPVERLSAWVQGYGMTALDEPFDDADADGLTNLEEYLTESDPVDRSHHVRPIEFKQLVNGNHEITLVETFDLAGRGLATEVQSSSDLNSWVPVTDLSETSNVRQNSDGVRVITMERTPSPAEDGPLYYRLKITL